MNLVITSQFVLKSSKLVPQLYLNELQASRGSDNHSISCFVASYLGRAITQAVGRWLPTAAAWVRSCGICGEQSGTGAGLL
jgi:hypothetical protein